MRMRPFGRLLPLDAALRRTLAAVTPVRGYERVALADALGRVSAATVRARRPSPAFSRATWDGYAVRSADLARASARSPVVLRLVGEVFAEGRLDRPLGSGETAAIATGGALPTGADAVVIFEEASAHDDAVTVGRPVPRGDRVAAPGDDFAKGAVLVRSGEVLDPARVGAVGAAGATHVEVRRRPRVTFVANGTELRPLGARLRRGEVHEINNLTLGTLARASGAEVVQRPPVPDDLERLERVIADAAASSDLVVVTGGSSVGEHDHLPAIFPRLGRLLYHGVAVRPGKPTLAARGAHGLLLGMPGHPTSCLSNGLWLLLPVLRRLAGVPGDAWSEVPVRLGAAVRRPSPDLSTVVALHVENGVAWPTFRDSSAITSLSGANAYAILRPGARAPRVGARLTVRRLAAPIGAP